MSDSQNELMLALGRLQGTTEMILANQVRQCEMLEKHDTRLGSLEHDKARRDGRAAVVASIVAVAITLVLRWGPFVIDKLTAPAKDIPA